jgi:hypothetical protein
VASPSVTYTFANSTTADASQVNTNFTDLINGLTDGTKDLSISALTVGGTATLNGSVNLGNASGDDLTITASLASTLSVKTTYSYDLGSSTIGLRSIYLGDAGSAARATRLIGATVASGYTFTLPTSGGTSRYRMETDGSGTTSWQPVRRSANDVQNFGLSAAVAASALTITLKGADGNDPSATNPVDIVFRSATATTGTATTVSATSALTVTLSSGSTLGTVSGKQMYVYVYAINNAGTIELAVSGRRFWDESRITTTEAEGGAGAADSATSIYSTTARASVAIRYLGCIRSSQTTAGTWASAPTTIELNHLPIEPGFNIGTARTSNSVVTSASYADPTNQPSLTFTAQRTSVWKIECSGTLQGATSGQDYAAQINDDGSLATSLHNHEALLFAAAANDKVECTAFRIFRLYAGVSTTFTLQMKGTSGAATWLNGSVTDGNAIIATQLY